MAGTMKFSEVPPYPYTCRSLHRVRTGKMRDEADFCTRSYCWRSICSLVRHYCSCDAAQVAIAVIQSTA